MLDWRTMTIVECAPEPKMSIRRAQLVAETVRPPRLNFAGRCIYCLERDCGSPDCEDLHKRSRWAVCPDCDGREGDEVTSTSCTSCVFGVVELVPIGVGGAVDLR